MTIVANRLLKGVGAGEAVGADELGRYLSADQRQKLITHLSGEVAERAAALIEDARAAAAAILGDAEVQADAVRRQAQNEGFAAGHIEGFAAGQQAVMAELEPMAILLREAADGAELVRLTLLEGVEEQAVALAMAAARRVVGAVADTQADLAATVVRNGIRSAGARTMRVRVHPDSAESVTAALLDDGKDVAVQADASVEIGGCMLDIENGTVDLRLATQLESIARSFGLGAADDAGQL